MKWRQIDKKSAQAPTTGTYGDWKPQLAKEAECQCVYCCIHEAGFGGIRNFHVEHYKPQSKFPELKNVYSNLFYACGVCNVFKSNDWPGELASGELSRPGYPDPSQVDYGNFLAVDQYTGLVASASRTGKYIIERLHLNRPHLISLRAWTELHRRFEQVHAELRVLIDTGVPASEKDAVMDALLNISALMLRLDKVRPYAPDQLR